MNSDSNETISKPGSLVRVMSSDKYRKLRISHAALLFVCCGALIWMQFGWLVVLPIAVLLPQILPGVLTPSQNRELARKLVSNQKAMLVLVLTLCVILSGATLNFLYDICTVGGLPGALVQMFLFSALFPLSGIAALYLSRSMGSNVKIMNRAAATMVEAKQKPSSSQVSFVKTAKTVKTRIALFLKNRYPFLSFYCGFLSFCLASSYALGGDITHFFLAALRGAHVLPDYAHFLSLVFIVPVFLFLFTTFRSLAVRFGAGFQRIATRMIFHSEGLLDATLEAIGSRTTKLPLVENHPHLRNVMSISFYLLACYVCTFLLIAFCPPPVGRTINDWLANCVRDAHFAPSLYTLNLRLFFASVIAAFATVPVAVMSCSFLPSKQPKTLSFTSQGVLLPNSSTGILALAPFNSWTELKAVSVLHTSEREKQSLQLDFGSGGKIKLKTKSLAVEQLYELLSAADEYAPVCRFDQSAANMRTELASQVKNNVLSDAKKYSSTIFTPRKSGERLKDLTYRVVRVMSRKPLSAVYLARDQADRQVVIKEFVLPTAVEQCERLDESFNREYELLKELHHDRIAAVLEKFEEGGARYLVIEHVRGIDLRSLVARKGPRTEKKVISWAIQIAELMIFLHSRQPAILHRDLTPDNLMDEEDGALKLIDFGAAHQFMEGVTGTLIGKQCYIAPEQLRGKATTRSDIYSFGCTLYYLLVGKDPKALQQCDFDLDTNIRVSSYLKDLVRKCTHFDEHSRYESFEQILADLESRNIRPVPGKPESEFISPPELQADLIPALSQQSALSSLSEGPERSND